jgi:hypothetical protein
MSEQITRYNAGSGMYASDYGEWVKHDDHVTAMQGNDAEIERLTDLVRYMRQELFDAKLIDAEEFAALVEDSEHGKRVARLEGYDKARRLREAASALEKALTLVEPAINNAFVFSALHGQNYEGPTYGEELKALRAVLASTPKPAASGGVFMEQIARGTYKILYADGREAFHEETPRLARIQQLIGAETIDTVTLDRRTAQIMVVDDTGMVDGRPVNARATELYHAVCKPGTVWAIHGDVALVNDRDFA